MKILVVSDTHCLEVNANLYYKIKPDMAIHCGDSQFPYNHFDMKCYDYKVAGNCDLDANYPQESIFEIAGIKCFLVHGHYHNIKSSLINLTEVAKKNKCKIAFYGHDHVFNVAKVNDVIVINPGSIQHSRSVFEESFILIETNENIFNISVLSYPSMDIIKTYKLNITNG